MSIATAEQHRWMARNILANAGKPGYPTKERAPQMAKHHEIMAKMIEARERGDYIPRHWNMPPLAPT